MSVLAEVLRHPSNRGHGAATVAIWARHNLARRLHPEDETAFVIAGTELVGPTDHPTVNYAVYVRDGYYDLEAMWALEWLTSPGGVFIDIGANLGGHAAVAARSLGRDGVVVAVEPLASQRRWLRRNLARLPCRTELVPLAVADRPGELRFAEEGETMGRLATSGAPVEVTTVDALVDRFGVRGGVAKIDVEGWEAAVVAGARRWLATAPAGLVIEANGFQDRCHVPWTDAVVSLRDAGYRFLVPDRGTGAVRQLADPGIRSAIGDYIVVRDDLVAAFADDWRAFTASGFREPTRRPR